MRFNIPCAVLLVVVCLVTVESTFSRSKLNRFLIKVNSWKKSNTKSQPVQSVLSRLRNKVALVFKRTQSTSNSVGLPAKDSSQDCNDVVDALEELYKDLCTVKCSGKDYYCNLVIYRYIKPLCVYRDAQKAAKALLVKIGCKQMSYRKTLICKTKSVKACELAEEVADFCEAAEQDCDKTPVPTKTGVINPGTPAAPTAPAAPTPTAPAAPTATADPATPTAPAATKTPEPTTTTAPPTTTTTESGTTLNPGPLASDFKCDSFFGKCYLGGCPSPLSEVDFCETSGYTCCNY